MCCQVIYYTPAKTKHFNDNISSAISFDIFLGSAILNSNAEGTKRFREVDAVNGIVHPLFDSNNLNYDVALIRLPEVLGFTGENRAYMIIMMCKRLFYF